MKYIKEQFIYFPTTFYIQLISYLKAYSPSHLSSPQSLTVLTATAVAALGVP